MHHQLKGIAILLFGCIISMGSFFGIDWCWIGAIMIGLIGLLFCFRKVN